ncbi:hypothetical protein E2C01_022230 [Portunus trituberculatus]|uniref:Uncharacterized protein n=1 Tax=Portunus trituberculatus TaxID=210409 RepID=A0A5B7E8C5_PORTR|nr:hypothetical protein [Portunus trituberculatus]
MVGRQTGVWIGQRVNGEARSERKEEEEEEEEKEESEEDVRRNKILKGNFRRFRDRYYQERLIPSRRSCNKSKRREVEGEEGKR